MTKLRNLFSSCLLIFSGLTGSCAMASEPALTHMKGKVMFGFEFKQFQDSATQKTYWIDELPESPKFEGDDNIAIPYEIDAQILQGEKTGYGHLGKWKQAVVIKSWKPLVSKPKSEADQPKASQNDAQPNAK